MEKVWPGILMLSIAAVVIALLLLGWRNRKRRQSQLSVLPPVPELGPATLSVEGQYVSTTSAGDWLDRLAAHDLGLRSKAQLSLHPEGILLLRPGFADIFIPAQAVEEVRLSPGMAGKFIGKDAIVITTWRLGNESVDTGFLPRFRAERPSLAEAIRALAP